MPYVVKDARGRSPYWFAVYRDATGRRLKKSTKLTSKSKALEMAYALHKAGREAKAKRLTEARTRDLLSEILESVNGVGLRVFTVAQWFDHFVKQKQKSRADKTAAAHEQVRDQFIEFLGRRAHENLAGVSSEDIAAFRDHRESLGLAPNTLNKDVDCLKAAFGAALKQGHISVNPCAVIENVKDKTEARKEPFTLGQITALGKTASGDWRGLILTAFYTGQRLGDCANLRWDQIDLASKIIRFQPGKTGGEIIMPLNPVLADYLGRLAKSKAGETFVFPSLAQRNISPLSKYFKKIMQRAGIEQRVIRERKAESGGRCVNALTFHSLRHTFNSILANAGIPEETRMALTGHTTREMNQRYTHRELAIYREAVSVLPRV
jgi:integrase